MSVRILGIETSCDDTAAAVVDDGGRVLSSVISSQESFHRKYEGVVPEIASRRHTATIIASVDEALQQAGLTLRDVDGIAVTTGPGLIGSLLIGVETAKALAYATGLPLVGVNHLEGHVMASFVTSPGADEAPLGTDAFPLLALIVSGGHTELVIVTSWFHYRVLGATRDDAAGETLDKFAKFLGLGYPGGPVIQRIGAQGDPDYHAFPRVSLGREGYEFSFSGLKTAGINYVRSISADELSGHLPDIVASFEFAVVRELLSRTSKAVREFRPAAVTIVGGVAANQRLRRGATAIAETHVHFPPMRFCTDNAAMIAYAGLMRIARGERTSLDLDASPSVGIEDCSD
ncbi:MAG: tRNA (adenosine(37)-N6)-threonylcarbamoyltransferase complex transferase subunit TsaD [Caldisericota bacterium]|nr:tRNA (adenosine(37)-N6)-threonylcarbamoyltransferase complex transferase subunit TsaD [Caldisericota bacterium]